MVYCYDSSETCMIAVACSVVVWFMELTVYDCFCADSCCMRRLWDMSFDPMLGPGLPIPPWCILAMLSGDVTG